MKKEYNYDCDNNPNWDKHCAALVEHCGDSVVARMYCKKTCGSCKEEVHPSFIMPNDGQDNSTKLAGEEITQNIAVLGEEKTENSIEAATDAALKDLHETQTEVSEDDGHISKYMKQMSNMYNNYFSVSTSGMMPSAEESMPVELSREDDLSSLDGTFSQISDASIEI